MSTKKRTGEDALFESGLPDEVIFYAMVEALIAGEKTEKEISNILFGEWDEDFAPFYIMFTFSRSMFGDLYWLCREEEYCRGHRYAAAEFEVDNNKPIFTAPLPPREKCYIAGAIGSMPEAEYRPLFEAGVAEARALGFEPISPIDLPHNHDRSYGSYMKEDLTELLKCKAIYVLRNWRHSPGAKFEIETAVFCGINVIFQ